MSERVARLRALTAGPTWSDVNALLSESVNELLQKALMAEKEGDAIHHLKEARAAQSLAREFVKRIELTAATTRQETE